MDTFFSGNNQRDFKFRLRRIFAECTMISFIGGSFLSSNHWGRALMSTMWVSHHIDKLLRRDELTVKAIIDHHVRSLIFLNYTPAFKNKTECGNQRSIRILNFKLILSAYIDRNRGKLNVGQRQNLTLQIKFAFDVFVFLFYIKKKRTPIPSPISDVNFAWKCFLAFNVIFLFSVLWMKGRITVRMNFFLWCETVSSHRWCF